MMSPWNLTQSIPINATASLLNDNLSWSSGSGALVFATKNKVQVVPGPTSKSKEQKKLVLSNKDTVMHARHLMVGHDEVLVLVATSGVQFWDNNGSKTLAPAIPISQVSPRATEPGFYCRGITARAGAHSLFLGTSSGEVVRIHFSEGVAEVEASWETTHGAISCLVSTTQFLITGHDDGAITLWDDERHTVVHTFETSGEPCSTMAVRGDYLVAGFANGKVSLYKLSSCSLEFEISAHIRNITALDIHQSLNMFVTTSEDTFVNVWSFPTKMDEKVSLLHSGQMVDSMVTGAQFSKEGSSDIALVAYDNPNLTVWLA